MDSMNDRREVTFEIQNSRNNELFNESTLQYYIESSFQTRGQTPQKQVKRNVSQYVDTVCKDKPSILRKLRKINYNRFFGNQFEVA
jgi:hypothetical protein